MDAYLLSGLLRWNPWLTAPSVDWARLQSAGLPSPFVARRVTGLPAADPKRALVVLGPRQAGKSTFLRELVRQRHRSCLHLVLDDPLLASWCRSPSAFATDLEGLPYRPEALLFDEIQQLPNAGLFLKGLIDLKLGVPIYATGSAAWHLHDRVRESLAGRASRMRLYPFSMAEILAAKSAVNDLQAVLAAPDVLRRQLVFGGYPDVVLGGDEARRLFDLVEAVILRDASDLYKIKKPEAFRKLLRLMAGQAGNLARFSELASVCQIAVTTVQDYANLLEESHVVRLLPVFAGGRRAELTATPKVFFVDNGVRNLLTGDFSAPDARADRGALFENWVFTELLKMLVEPTDLHYWRTRAGAEVDFVLHRPGRRPVGIEAKLDGEPPRLTRGARSFLEAYQPEVFVTVTTRGEGEATIGGCHAVWCAPHRLREWIPRAFLELPGVAPGL
jgi:predicted AAA+ superfamily ATPase